MRCATDRVAAQNMEALQNIVAQHLIVGIAQNIVVLLPHRGQFVEHCDVSEAFSTAQSYNSDRRQIAHPGLG